MFLGVDSLFFSAIVLFKNRIRFFFFRVSGGFLERRIPGKNGHGRYPWNVEQRKPKTAEASQRWAMSSRRCPRRGLKV